MPHEIDPRSARVLFRGVFLIAFAMLLFEVTLIRVLSFTIWYHFAYVVISTALLGFGASGTLLALRPGIGESDLETTLARLSAAAAVSGVAFLLLVAWLPLHPMEAFARPGQLILLMVYQLGAAVPFFFAGLVVSLSLRAAARRVDRLYFWDLVGGGLGCGVAVHVMNLLSPPGSVLVACAAFALAALAFSQSGRFRVAAAALAVVLLAASPFALRLPFTVANSKELSKHLNVFAMEPVFTRWTALFRTDVVEKFEAGAPLTNDGMWGLSRRVTHEVQKPCCYINHDGTAGTPIYDFREGPLDFLSYDILLFPYLVSAPKPEVLVIGVGGGRDVIAAVRSGASKVTGVELDPVTVEVIQTGMQEKTRGFFQRPEIRLVASEGRHFVKTTDAEYDVIQMTQVDTLSTQSSGAYVLAENYLYTVEAFHDYLDHLKPGGLLSINTGHLYDTQPRAAGRVVSVAQQALRERGIARPEQHIAVVDSRHMSAAILIRPDGFTAEQLDRLVRQSNLLGFPLLNIPGRQSHPLFYALAATTGAEREKLLAEQRYTIDAITDDSPFFFRFYRWSELLTDQLAPSHTTAMGQLVLLLLLCSLTAFGALLILVPLLVLQRRGITRGGRASLGILLYFLALGLGFMFFEISLMQRFVLYLGYPTYSLSVVLFTLLVSLGCGSFVSRRWVGRERLALPVAIAVLAALTLFYMRGMPPLQEATLGLGLGARVVLSILMLAPLGLVLGAFLPLGIRRAEEVHRDLVPWAWAVNGCASVTATVLAVVLAMSFGFQFVWLLSLLVYLGGAAALLLLAPRSAPVAEPAVAAEASS